MRVSLFALVSYSLLSLLSDTAIACSVSANETHQKGFLVANAASYFDAPVSELKSANVIAFDTIAEGGDSECPETVYSWGRVSLKWSENKSDCTAAVTVDARQQEGSQDEVDFLAPEVICN